MALIPLFHTPSSLAQFNKRDQTATNGGDGSNGNTPLAILAVVIAALTPVVAIMAYPRQEQSQQQSVPLFSLLFNSRLPPHRFSSMILIYS